MVEGSNELVGMLLTLSRKPDYLVLFLHPFDVPRDVTVAIELLAAEPVAPV